MIFFKIIFLKNSFRNTIRVSYSLDPDQARHFVGPYLGPKCLPRLSADDTSSSNRFHICLYEFSGGDDRRVLVWQVEKMLSDIGTPSMMSGEHNSNIFCIAFDLHNRTIFSGGKAKIYCITVAVPLNSLLA